MRNYYKVLEIPEFSDTKQIHSAYRRLAKLYHPDVNPHYTLAAEIFKLVNEAYAVLSDPQRKMAYDDRLRQKNEQAQSNCPEKACDETYSTAENNAGHHLKNSKWDVDDYFFANCGHFGNAYDRTVEESNRIPLFLKIVFFIDFWLVGYFIYWMSNIDLAIVPKVYHIADYHSWLIDLECAVGIQKLSICLSVFLLLVPWLQKTSLFYSIFKMFTVRGLDMWYYLMVAQLTMKVMASYDCVAPFFGMSLFDLPNRILLYAFLWHFFMFAVLFVWLMDPDGFGSLK